MWLTFVVLYSMGLKLLIICCLILMMRRIKWNNADKINLVSPKRQRIWLMTSEAKHPNRVVANCEVGPRDVLEWGSYRVFLAQSLPENISHFLATDTFGGVPRMCLFNQPFKKTGRVRVFDCLDSERKKYSSTELCSPTPSSYKKQAMFKELVMRAGLAKTI